MSGRPDWRNIEFDELKEGVWKQRFEDSVPLMAWYVCSGFDGVVDSDMCESLRAVFWLGTKERVTPNVDVKVEECEHLVGVPVLRVSEPGAFVSRFLFGNGKTFVLYKAISRDGITVDFMAEWDQLKYRPRPLPATAPTIAGVMDHLVDAIDAPPPAGLLRQTRHAATGHVYAIPAGPEPDDGTDEPTGTSRVSPDHGRTAEPFPTAVQPIQEIPESAVIPFDGPTAVFRTARRTVQTHDTAFVFLLAIALLLIAAILFSYALV